MDLPKTLPDAMAFYDAARTHHMEEGGPKAFREWERWLIRHDLFYCLIRGLRRMDANHPWIFERCRMVQAEPNGYLDLWAREHYKSTIITFALTIQDLLNDPEITVGIFSHTRKIAKTFLQQIMRELEDNKFLQSLFPDVLWKNPRKDASKWSEEEGIIVRRRLNPKESTVEAWGLVDNQPTGRHFRLRIYDDVVTRDSVSTPDQVSKTTSAWELSENLGVKEEAGGIVRYIGTRYSLYDSYSTMLERGAVKPRIFAATDNGQFSGSPVFFSVQEWQKRLRNQSRSTVAAQLLQNPLADTEATFRAEWLRPYEVRPRTMNVYITCDPSLGRSATSDNTAIAVVGISSSGGKYLLDGYCHRMSLSDRWIRIRDLYKKWSAAIGVQHIQVGYERYGMQSDLEYFEERMLREKLVFPIDELSWTRDNTESKQERVARLEPDFRNGRFYVPLHVFREGQAQYWTVDRDPESKRYNQIEYRESLGLTVNQMKMLKEGQADMVARPLKAVDSEGKLYDLTVHFFEEFCFFPFGRWRDLIDAVSRIYDMEPTGPVVYRAEQLNQPAFWDA